MALGDMRASMIYSILENRIVYNLSQAILAPRGVSNLRRRVDPYLNIDGAHRYRVLELGCGTGSFSLQRSNVRYTGTDVNAAYFPSRPPAAEMSYEVMDATRLDFSDGHFNLVYSIGLYHHLTDVQMLSSLEESRRVLAAEGRIVLVDNIWPTHGWNVPAWLIRRLDRGGHVRTGPQIENLVNEAELNIDSIETFFYTVTGLEAVILQMKA